MRTYVMYFARLESFEKRPKNRISLQGSHSWRRDHWESLDVFVTSFWIEKCNSLRTQVNFQKLSVANLLAFSRKNG